MPQHDRSLKHPRAFRPGGYRNLNREQIVVLHNASLEIMERTGMRFFDQEALDLFRKAGARITDGNIVHVPADLVEWARSTVPENVNIYDRNRELAMALGGDRTYFGVGSDCMSIYDLETGEHRRAKRSDVVDGVRLVDALANMDFVMSMFLPSDVSQADYERHQMAIMLQESTKPIIFVGIEQASTVMALDMAAAVAGGLEPLQRYPFVINYVNTVSDFHHNGESLQRLLYAAERNIPSIYAPGSTRGTLAPITSAGAMALHNAAQLAGLVLSQLKREGSPLILCGRSGGFMDMRTMLSLYTAPDAGPYGWDLARHYRIPTFSAACTDAKVFDAQAAAETALTLFDKALNGANIVHDLGYLDCAMTGCLELVLFSDEIVEWIKRFWQPVEINAETLALDVIHAVGPDGHFLETSHTLDHFRELWAPRLLDRFDFETWSARGAMTVQEKANQKVKEIIASHRAARLPSEVVARLEDIVARR
ncbi:MAG: trimethylamine methyltransferase family protein [Deltaproteobacteria bacterium]|nr:trimethylamine methyltransferase family protein [Deltaproteobacteria bacterium]